jgi:hypothetical protein
MAAVNTGAVPGLVELVKKLDPDGSAADVAEILSQSTPLIDVIPWFASNQITTHRSTIRTGLPTTSKRRVNEPVASSRGTTAQIVDGMAIFETRCTVDKLLVDLAPTASAKMAVRVEEGSAHIESIGQAVEEEMWYGDITTDDLGFNGFTVRYDTTGGSNANSMFDMEGANAGDMGSVWLLGLGPRTVFGIYPQGSVAGLMHHDDGLRDRTDPTEATDAVGGRSMLAYRDIWGWHCGLVVKDWRFALRGHSCDFAHLRALNNTQSTADGRNLVFTMDAMLDRLPNRSAVQPVFVMSREMKEGYNRLVRALARANIWQPVQVNGMVADNHSGVPILVSDRLRTTENVPT